VKIKRWALLTVLLYLLTLFILTGPVLFASFLDRATPFPAFSDVQEFYHEIFKAWPYWLALGIVGILQALVLLAPIQVARQRPISRAPWIWLALTAGFLMGLLFLAMGAVALETLFFDKGSPEMFMAAGAGALLSWAVWFVVFLRYAQVHDDASRIVRVVDRLIAGSIAELLVAVPCHVYVRDQKYCCAGFGTFVGIATGLSVLFFAFGPGVFFLFVKRARRLQGAHAELPRLLPDFNAHLSELNGETKDAGIWALAASAILLVPLGVRFAHAATPPEFFLMSRIGFIVMGCVSLYHGTRGYRELGRQRRWVLFAGAALVEAVSLVAWWSFV